MVNLLVDLRDERFDAASLSRALQSIEAAGFTVERGGDDHFFAWLDDEFGGTWSTEAFAGTSVIARNGDTFAGFATYDPKNLRFSWLRGIGAEPGVGIFGPFGVGREFRGMGIGPQLLVAALCSLRERGYSRALIPAVGNEKLISYYREHSGAEVVERFDRAAWFEKRYRTVVLASGNGSNFQSVIDRSADGRLPLDLVMLVSNRAGAYALERARKHEVHAVTLTWDRNAESREHYDAALTELVAGEMPDLVLLLGWMHLLPREFVERFCAINIHPAFLPLDQRCNEVTFPDGTTTPAFRGADAIGDALRHGARWVGATCHRVEMETDRGVVLTRKPMPLQPGEQADAILERLHPLEHAVLAGGILRWVFEQ